VDAAETFISLRYATPVENKHYGRQTDEDNVAQQLIRQIL